MRTSLIIVENFYADPSAVREYAQRQRFYYPYQDADRIARGESPAWLTTMFREADDCPFKSSAALIERLETATGETIDLDHWKRSYPTLPDGRAARAATAEDSCLWNGALHVKPGRPQPLGEGVHNHVTDIWNSVGEDGWAGIVYLSKDAPLGGGLKTWRNRNPVRNFDWMTPADNWELIDDIGNVCNRLVLARGDIPHSGSEGWGDGVASGRLFQTFFFRTLAPRRPAAVELALPEPPQHRSGQSD